MNKIKMQFLGTGDVRQVPVYGCECPACQAAIYNPKKARKATSAEIIVNETHILLDAGLCDLTERFPPGSLQSVILTHFHADHVQGLMHLRWGVSDPLPVYCPNDPEGFDDLFKHPGCLQFNFVEPFESFMVADIKIMPLPLLHSRKTLGYAISHDTHIAYLTDTKGLPEETLGFLRSWGVDELILDCTHQPGDPAARNHNDLNMALDIVERVGAKHAWLTHIGHQMDCWLIDNLSRLPASVSIAQDNDAII